MQAASRSRASQKLPEAEFRVLAERLEFPEGPIAMPDGSILFVEIAAGRLSRLTPDGVVETVAETGGGPNGAAIGPDGHCYVCNNGGFSWHRDEDGLRPTGPAADYSGGLIQKVDIATGQVTTLYSRSEHGPLRAPNDIVFDRDGGFWFTDVGIGRHREMDFGSVYYAAADGSSIVEAISPMLQPNGVGLSPDEKILYVAETITGRVWAFDIASPGEITKQPWPSINGGRLLTNMPGYRFNDSLAIDADGNVVVATLLDGGVVVVAPDGTWLKDVRLPDKVVTNVCFGGPDLTTAYVTMSHSGRLIAIDLGTAGLPLNF
jgi:gluconolactonase